MAQQEAVHKTRTQAVVEILRERILSGELAAGKPLRQSSLAAQLNVSRIPIREALLQLEAEGLVRFEAHKGATATELSLPQMEELFELRQLVEPGLLQQSVALLTEQQLIQAENYLSQLEQSLQDPTQSSRWSELNSRFHMSLYAGAEKPHTKEVIRALNTKSDRYIRIQLLKRGSRPKAEQEHRQLLALCQQGKASDAAELLRQHIKAAATSTRELIADQMPMQANK